MKSLLQVGSGRSLPVPPERRCRVFLPGSAHCARLRRRLASRLAAATLHVTLFLAVGCGRPIPLERDLLIATGNPGGTYYPVGVAMATMVTGELGPTEGILLSPITSAGSQENIAMLQSDEAQLGILQGIFASMAWQGTGLYEGRRVATLRGLATLWPNVEQVLIFRRFVRTGTVEDLGRMPGETISLGPRSSGTELSGRTILRTLGIEPGNSFRVANLEYGPSADALQNRRIAGFFLPGGVPTGAIAQSFATMGGDSVALLEFTDGHLDRLRARYPVWNRFIIPAHTYPGQEEPVRTLAQLNVLATTSQASEEVIYMVMRTLWTRIDFLHRQHAATRQMTLETAVDGLPLPLHPGAIRFYKEAGVEVPAELHPPGLPVSSPP